VAINYQAKIDLIVAGLEQIEAAEKRIKSLLKESKKLQRGGIAQRGTAALAATTRESRQGSRRQVRNAERRLELQSKLNAATDLYNRKLQQFQRAGGAGNKQLQGRVDQITQAFAVGTKEGTKNLRLTRALATELGRVVEKQRELNRARVQGNKGFEATRRGEERVEALRSSLAVDPRRLSGAASLVSKIPAAAASGDQTAFNEAVRKADVALRRLEREFQQAERAQRASTKAKRDVERAEKKLAAETKKAAAAQKKRRDQRRQRFQNIATGAGFPLLFGGGPVQALAGGIGGALGGFGGSIAATALAGQAEAFARAAAETGVALTSTGGALDFMREKSLFSTAAAKERAAQLEELGRVEELAAHLGQEMANAIGNNGVKALRDLGDTTKETTRLWNLLTTQLFRLVSGPLDAFLKAINRVLGQVTTGSSFKALLEDLAPDQRAKAEARFEELRGRVGTGRSAAQSQTLTDTEAQKIVLKEFGGLQKAAATPTPITDEDRRRFALKSGKDKLPDLLIEIGLQERLLALDKQIAQATLDENDKIKSILEKEKIRETLEANINKIKNDGLQPALEAAKIELARIDAAQKIQDIDIKTAQVENDKAKKVQETVKSLENEGALLQAKLDGNETEVALKQKIAEATKDMSAEDAKRVEKLIRGNALLAEQNKIADQMKQIYEQIGMSIKTGVVDAISAAVDGTKSLAEVASNTLRNIAKQLLNIGVNFALFGTASGTGVGGGLLGPLFRADGGPVKGNSPYIVGERGPELFVPRSSGTVVPNHAMGGATVNVAVNASGSSVEGSADQAGQLGKAIGVAVQQELIKQKRPGGLLAS
jgi:hypothetical protein